MPRALVTRSWFVLGWCWLASCAGCFGAQRQPADLNVILISIDTLRADHLGCYGYRRSTSPTLDRFAQQGVRFSNFHAVSPWTLPSHASIFTGMYPSVHGADAYLIETTPGQLHLRAIRSSATTLAEILRDHGYTTQALVSTNTFVSGKMLGRGFEEYRENLGAAVEGAPKITAAAVDWLEQNAEKKKFFLFLHYYDVHSPYITPPPYYTLYTSDGGPYEEPYNRVLSPPQKEVFTARYDSSIRYTDDSLKELFSALDRLKLASRTLVVVTSDHGEGLAEHKNYWLHYFLYGDTLRIPFLLRFPGRLPAGKVVEALGSHIDIAPTILDFLDLPAKADAQGSSLLPLARGEKKQIHSEVFAESEQCGRLRGVRTGRYSFIKTLRTGSRELYDLQSDPREQRNLLLEIPRIAKEMESRLDAWTGKMTQLRATHSDEAQLVVPGEVAAQQLRVAGYVQEPWIKRGSFIDPWWVDPDPTVVDDDSDPLQAFILKGATWTYLSARKSYAGGAYLNRPGGGEETVKWEYQVPADGVFRILYWHGLWNLDRLATNAPFTVYRNGRQVAPLKRVDQTQNGGQWNTLERLAFKKGERVAVVLSNDANGYILADAVKFELEKE